MPVFDEFHDNCAFDSLPVEAIHPDQLAKEPVAATLGDTPENRRIALSGYFAAVTEMDRNIGRLLDWLEVKRAARDYANHVHGRQRHEYGTSRYMGQG